jgi:hypothetical protein
MEKSQSRVAVAEALREPRDMGKSAVGSRYKKSGEGRDRGH